MAVEMEGELIINKDDFNLGTLDDELRVDGLCQKLLKRFYLQLLEDGLTPEKATLLANSADYFVRDFIISIKQRNLFEEWPGLVRQFAGNWYIVSNIEPRIDELSGHLEGIRSFYRFLHSRRLVTSGFLDRVERECDDTGYYAERVDSFWRITGDGYFRWESECTLKDQ